MALHEQCTGASDDWFTPRYIFTALGCEFDMDVASPGPHVVPWIPASRWWSEAGLDRMWIGFIWMNPPFGKRNGLVPWLVKFFKHANGIALVPDRTSAPWWQRFAPQADAILFVSPKIKFISTDGQPGASPAQGTCLMAIGDRGVSALRRAQYNGLGFLMVPAER